MPRPASAPLAELDLGDRLSKPEYRAVVHGLQARLHQLQRACWEGGFGTLVLLEGWNLAGKGDCMNKLTQRMEPRAFRVHLVQEARSRHLRMPWLWRFWMTIPSYGEFALLQGSWYRRVSRERLDGSVGSEAAERAFDDIRRFESMLVDDRYFLVKVFLHIDKEEQHRRLEAMSNATASSWRIEEDDWKQHERYDEHFELVERMLEKTDREVARWSLIAANDRRWARVRVLESVIEGLEHGLRRRKVRLPDVLPGPLNEADDRYLDEEADA